MKESNDVKKVISQNMNQLKLPKVEPLTSHFPLSEIELYFFDRKFQIKLHKQCKTVHRAYVYRLTLKES
jgi:hypothetical protein